MKKKIDLFLDSGAFSAFTKGVQISIKDYIQFVKDNLPYLTCYVNLDVIGDAEATYKNQKIMEKAGLRPMPVFHAMFEDIKWLEKYIKEGYDYIGVGGIAGTDFNKKQLIERLDDVFEFICDTPKRLPKVKIHGFGTTILDLLLRYPWYSCDSTSWVLTGRFGAVLVPKMRGGNYSYTELPWKVTVSDRSPAKDETGKHFQTYSPMEQKIILNYLNGKGYVIGKSEYEKVEKGYKLKKGEKWFGKEEADSQRNVKGEDRREGFVELGYKEEYVVERVIEPGLCNNYQMRDELNVIYFLDLEKNFPKWPWPFKKAGAVAVGGFGLR